MAKSAILTKDEILHLAKLANLSLTDEEIQKYSKQLTETIAYAKNLEELDTSKVKPTSSSAQLENVFFEDGTKNTRGLSADKAVANAKEKKSMFFKVGRIM